MACFGEASGQGRESGPDPTVADGPHHLGSDHTHFESPGGAEGRPYRLLAKRMVKALEAFR